MPTINFSLKDLEKLAGKKLTEAKLKKLLEYGKGQVDGIEEDNVTASFGDTNMPYLWSVEGIARMIKGVLGKQKGIPKIQMNKNEDYKIIVDGSVKKIRPYIASFVAKGRKIDDYFLKQMIQLQEKLGENYGRRRQKLAIGIYKSNKIRFPVHYKAVNPGSVAFTPLDISRSMTLAQILMHHPKGMDYAWILKDFNEYPVLIDSADDVLSFPPIINSADTGKVGIDDDELFFECTGTDYEAVNLAACIFSQALYDRGFQIYSVSVNGKASPDFSYEKIRISRDDIKEILGMELKDNEIKKLAEMAGHEYSGSVIKISPFRKDILHKVDLIEDIAIMHGYDRIKEKPLENYTAGETKKIVEFRDRVRGLAIGLEYQETLSPILSNKFSLYGNMNIEDFGTIEIEDYMSETFSCVRTWLIPTLMEVLSKNKHVDYPQKIFEQGLVTVKKEVPVDYERIALAYSDASVRFTDMKQALDFIMSNLELKYELNETEHNSFIEGRVARIIVNGRKIGYIGEISPDVLEKWDLKMPVVAMELNLSEILE